MAKRAGSQLADKAGRLTARQIIVLMEALQPGNIDINIAPDKNAVPKKNGEKPKPSKIADVDIDGVLDNLGRLRQENSKGSHIYMRPQRAENDTTETMPPIAMIDDLDANAVNELDRDVGVAAVVESSPGNYQAWVKLREDDAWIDVEQMNRIRRYLTHAYGGDPDASRAANQAARLPGFTNRKPKRAKEDGHQPFTCCRHADGTVPASDDLDRLIENVQRFEAEHGLSTPAQPKTQNQKDSQKPKRPGASMTPFGADAIGAGSTQAWKRKQENQKGSRKPRTPSLPSDPAQAFRQAWDQARTRNDDNSRCDFLAVRDLAKAGFSEDDAINALRQESPDLERRGKSDNYPEHTVRKAYDSVADQVPNTGPNRDNDIHNTDEPEPDHDGPSGPGV